mgnify:CR=1 FL=1|jgi:LemA protein|nr:LemA family protein [Rhodoferax sp.]
MGGSLLLWITLAVLLFWGVGLYNRLTRMRARAFGALCSVEKHLREYAELTREVPISVRSESGYQPLVQRNGASPHWALLLAEIDALDVTLKDVRQKPLAIEPMLRLQQSMSALQRIWHGWLALPGDLAGPAVPDDLQARWTDITQRVETSKNGYNQIVLKYNEALVQFPARLIVGLMGVRPGGLL